jgi:hypothetical protein
MLFIYLLIFCLQLSEAQNTDNVKFYVIVLQFKMDGIASSIQIMCAANTFLHDNVIVNDLVEIIMHVSCMPMHMYGWGRRHAYGIACMHS